MSYGFCSKSHTLSSRQFKAGNFFETQCRQNSVPVDTVDQLLLYSKGRNLLRYPARELVSELVCDQLTSWIA